MKTLSSEKSANQAIEAKLVSQLASTEEEVSNMESREVAALEETLAKLSGQLDHLIRQLSEVEAIREISASTSQDLVEVRVRGEEMRVQEEDQYKLVEKAGVRFDAAKELLGEAQDLRAALEADRLKNDRENERRLIPAQTEREGLLKEKEDLAGILSQLSRLSTPAAEEGRQALAEEDAAMLALRAETKQAKEEWEAVKVHTSEISEARDEGTTVTVREVEDNTDFKAKFEEARSAELERIEEAKRQRDAERTARLLQAREEAMKERHNLEFKVEILKRGTKIIEETEQAEDHLRSAPICLDNGGQVIDVSERNDYEKIPRESNDRTKVARSDGSETDKSEARNDGGRQDSAYMANMLTNRPETTTQSRKGIQTPHLSQESTSYSGSPPPTPPTPATSNRDGTDESEVGHHGVTQDSAYTDKTFTSELDTTSESRQGSQTSQSSQESTAENVSPPSTPSTYFTPEGDEDNNGETTIDKTTPPTPQLSARSSNLLCGSHSRSIDAKTAVDARAVVAATDMHGSPALTRRSSRTRSESMDDGNSRTTLPILTKCSSSTLTKSQDDNDSAPPSPILTRRSSRTQSRSQNDVNNNSDNERPTPILKRRSSRTMEGSKFSQEEETPSLNIVRRSSRTRRN